MSRSRDRCGCCAGRAPLVGCPGSSGRAWRSVRLSACLTGGQQKAGRAARRLVGWSSYDVVHRWLWLWGVRLCCAWPAAVLAVVAVRCPPSFSRKAFDGADGGQVILGGRPSLCTPAHSRSRQTPPTQPTHQAHVSSYSSHKRASLSARCRDVARDRGAAALCGPCAGGGMSWVCRGVRVSPCVSWPV